ncbi:DotU family type IV/VI secretion system protein, partial [Burkholderia pseudomallei]|uniref:DotU family type IV/VI secretion system protein n=1 Tax=Burkholderia pseudomallei TaxID=28450 RepID=UPI0021F78DD4
MSIGMPAQSLRMLLQDTMLHVALLTEGARISRVHDWRARCIALVRQFEQAMQDGGYRGGIANELGLAQCVLLDEMTMRNLSPEQKEEWLRELLQFRVHSTRDGLGQVRARVDRLSSAHSANTELLEMYSLFYEFGLLEDRKGAALAGALASEAKPALGKKTAKAPEIW